MGTRDWCGGNSRHGCERGGSRLNFLLVLGVIAAFAYVGFHVAPTIYYARTFEAFMQDTVNLAAVTDKSPAWVEQQLRGAFPDYDIPPEATVQAGVRDSRIEARAQYTRTIPLLVTRYDYAFDKTVRSSTATTAMH